MSAQDKEEVVESPDVHFDPIVKLAPVELKTLEEDEEEVFKMRAKLFRFDASADPPEWKERGTGEVKFLRHRKAENKNIRLLMRRDKTHKICANHYLTPDMKLQPSAGSDRAWVWTVQADFADEEAKVEQLAIRFKNAENANMFREEFDKYKSLNSSPTKPAAEDKLTEEMDKLKVEDKEEKDADDTSDPKTSESSGEGVKAESDTTPTDNVQESTKKDEQTDQQSGPAE